MIAHQSHIPFTKKPNSILTQKKKTKQTEKTANISQRKQILLTVTSCIGTKIEHC
jgi:hypothetical protein